MSTYLYLQLLAFILTRWHARHINYNKERILGRVYCSDLINAHIVNLLAFQIWAFILTRNTNIPCRNYTKPTWFSRVKWRNCSLKLRLQKCLKIFKQKAMKPQFISTFSRSYFYLSKTISFENKMAKKGNLSCKMYIFMAFMTFSQA